MCLNALDTTKLNSLVTSQESSKLQYIITLLDEYILLTYANRQNFSHGNYSSVSPRLISNSSHKFQRLLIIRLPIKKVETSVTFFLFE